MVATQFFIMAMGFMDTAMVGHYSAVDQAGVALGGNVLWPLFLMFSGMNMALTPIVAQLRGARRLKDTGEVIRQGLWMAVFASVVMLLVLPNAGPFFSRFGIDAVAVDVAVAYLTAIAWGIGPAIGYVTLRHVCEGLGHTLPPMIIAGIALAVNGTLNWILIFGKFGLPALGGEGCGWATAITMWMQLAMITVLLKKPYFRATRLLERFELPDPARIGRILRIGLPIAMTEFLEMGVFAIIGFLVGSIGVTAVAANAIAGHVNWATYVFPMAIGSAASIRVGYYVGAQNYDGARRVAKVSLALSLIYALLVSGLLILARESIAGIYSSDGEVIALAASLMLFVAVYQIVDDATATMVGVLRGFKDTTVPMVISLTSYWLFALPVAAALGFGWFGLEARGVHGLWAGLTLGVFLLGGAMALRVLTTSRTDSRILALSQT